MLLSESECPHFDWDTTYSPTMDVAKIYFQGGDTATDYYSSQVPFLPGKKGGQIKIRKINDL